MNDNPTSPASSPEATQQAISACKWCENGPIVWIRVERDELRSQLAETRGIAGALAERLMRHVCQKDDCEDASHKKDKDILAKSKAAGISPEEKS